MLIHKKEFKGMGIITMKKWWNDTVFYEIYMPSFCDGNGDGIGDFKGIISKLDYLQELGVRGIWLTPFYPSPKVDNGYDIADYYSVDKDYGTMKDFEEFIEEAHKRGIRVIADLVLNHTSSEHLWFKEARSSKDNPKRDWYIWKDGNNGLLPNNWESFFGGSAWEFDEKTEQYYYHAFAREQVDLNWANNEVKEAMLDIMKFWLDKGVDGFRLDVINFLTVNDEWRDNPFDEEKNEQIHLYDKDQNGILDVIKEIAAFVHSYGDKFLVGEVGSEDLEELRRYCGKDLLDVVFNFNLGSMDTLDIDKLFNELQNMNNVYDEYQTPTLFFGSHDMPRYISRFGEIGIEEERAELIATLMLTAEGVPFIYYGDEIGMRDLYVDDISLMRDVQGTMAYDMKLAEGDSEKEALRIANEKSRDKSRSPMQWNGREFAGFSEEASWISIQSEFREIHVEKQRKKENSLLHYYKRLIGIRNQEAALKYGEYTLLEKNNSVISYVREYNNEQIYIFLNFADQEQCIELGNSKYQVVLSNKQAYKNVEGEHTLFPNEALIVKELMG